MSGHHGSEKSAQADHQEQRVIPERNSSRGSGYPSFSARMIIDHDFGRTVRRNHWEDVRMFVAAVFKTGWGTFDDLKLRHVAVGDSMETCNEIIKDLIQHLQQKLHKPYTLVAICCPIWNMTNSNIQNTWSFNPEWVDIVWYWYETMCFVLASRCLLGGSICAVVFDPGTARSLRLQPRMEAFQQSQCGGLLLSFGSEN